MKWNKIIYILIVVLMASTLPAYEKSALARLHYDGGGDWYNDQDIIPNIAEFLNETLDTDFALIEESVKPSESKLFDYPFIFATGHGNISFNEKEASNLRKYLDRGGFLLVDDDYGLDKSFRKEVKKIFPEKDLVELPASHPLFHCYFDFPNGIPKTHKHDDKRPQAFAIFDKIGRLQLLYLYESNITDGWSDAHDDPPEIRQEAMQMGANIIYYLMTQ
ncbi:MAG: hypothetical protein DRH79_07680 [Candidatus Cloacimonadota bacterium]|nr:MAG: hypothetical protein DRH79_07680 [Candidatus Cloacimonadota bacterium]